MSKVGLCGYTRTRPVLAGKGRVGYDLYGYGYGATGMDTSGYLHALLAEISLFLPHVVCICIVIVLLNIQIRE